MPNNEPLPLPQGYYVVRRPSDGRYAIFTEAGGEPFTDQMTVDIQGDSLLFRLSDWRTTRMSAVQWLYKAKATGELHNP